MHDDRTPAPASPPPTAVDPPTPPDDGDPALIEDRDAAERAARQLEAGRPAAIAPRVRRPQIWLGLYVLAGAALLWAYPLIGTGFFRLPAEYAEPARRLANALIAATLIQGIASVIEVTVIARIEDAADRYTILKITDLISWGLVVLVGVTQVFDQWYTAVASLGLVSLVLGLALQEPISSFFAWVYIIARKPYRVGDRVQVKDMTGDVIQVGYLDTTLWEFGGPYLSTDHPSGRIIKFPNATVLNEAVINYTWPLFPYRWDEVRFQVAYDSDLEFVAETMRRVVEEEIGEEMMERVTAYRALLAKTPVDELTVQERPSVFFRVHENTWLQATVRYVVNPRAAGRVKNRLIPRLLKALNEAPDRVHFPRSDMR